MHEEPGFSCSCCNHTRRIRAIERASPRFMGFPRASQADPTNTPRPWPTSADAAEREGGDQSGREVEGEHLADERGNPFGRRRGSRRDVDHPDGLVSA